VVVVRLLRMSDLEVMAAVRREVLKLSLALREGGEEGGVIAQ